MRAVPTGGNTTIVGRVDGGGATADLTFLSSPTCADGVLGGTPTTLGTLAGVTLDDERLLQRRRRERPDPELRRGARDRLARRLDVRRRQGGERLLADGVRAHGAALTTQDVIDAPGQSKWYAFDIQPGSEVRVNISNLPADYDLALFKDITQAYTDLTSPQDLTRLSAEYAPSIFSPSIFSPSIFSPSIFSPDAYAPSIFSPSIFSPSIFSPSIFSPRIFSPSIFSPSIFSPSIFSPSIF